MSAAPPLSQDARSVEVGPVICENAVQDQLDLPVGHSSSGSESLPQTSRPREAAFNLGVLLVRRGELEEAANW
jgi:hypothetical protein